MYLAHGVRTRLNLDASGNRNSADTVWNDTYSRTANQLVNGDNAPNPLAAAAASRSSSGGPRTRDGCGIAWALKGHRQATNRSEWSLARYSSLCRGIADSSYDGSVPEACRREGESISDSR